MLHCAIHAHAALHGPAAIGHAWTQGETGLADQILAHLEQLGCRLGLTYWASLSAHTDAASADLARAQGLPRTEVLATREYLKHVPSDPARAARLDALLSSSPALHSA